MDTTQKGKMISIVRCFGKNSSLNIHRVRTNIIGQVRLRLFYRGLKELFLTHVRSKLYKTYFYKIIKPTFGSFWIKRIQILQSFQQPFSSIYNGLFHLFAANKFGGSRQSSFIFGAFCKNPFLSSVNLQTNTYY